MPEDQVPTLFEKTPLEAVASLRKVLETELAKRQYMSGKCEPGKLDYWVRKCDEIQVALLDLGVVERDIQARYAR